MKKRSKHLPILYKNPLLATLYISLTLISGKTLGQAVPSVSVNTDALDAAKSSAAEITPRFNSNKKVSKNAIDPMQGKSMMVAQDGSAFNASIQCASALPLVSVFAQPGSTNDLNMLIAKIDMDLNGVQETNLSTTVGVSGVCINGVISCDPGTWNNCEPYKWQSTDTSVNLNPTDITELKGCYCINNSCGSSLSITNIGVILRDIGTGITQSIQEVHPEYVVSSVKLDSSYAEIYGASGSGCRTGTTGQNEFLNNPISMESAIQNEVSTQTANNNSLYNLVTQSPATQGSAKTAMSCSITRLIDVTPDTCQLLPDTYQNTCITLENDASCNIRDEKVDGVITYENFTPTNLTPLPSTQIIGSPTGFINYTGDTTMELEYVTKNQTPPKKLYYSGTDTEYPSYSVITYKTKVKIDNEYIFVNATKMSINISDFISVESAVTNDSCADTELTYTITGEPYSFVIRQGYSPQLGEEYLCPFTTNKVTIKGVKNIQLPCKYNIERPWWYKERVYMCDSTVPAFDFEDAKKKVGAATNNPSLSTGFTNLTKDSSGNWQPETVGIGEPEALPVVDSCQSVCKVYKDVIDDRVTTTTTTSQVKTSQTKRIYRYPTCADNTCPTEEGEVIEKGCQCIDEFAEAATIMQSIRFAGQDVTCK